ncbi:hypothetical protein DVH05_021889 [Phytophthora capsici]|nr:hypothetical protein DVH05_021889 [Phytophthora capsici]
MGVFFKVGDEIGAGDFGRYVRFEVFALRVYNRAIRIRDVSNLFTEIIKGLQKPPSDDFQPLTDQAFMERANDLIDQALMDRANG